MKHIRNIILLLSIACATTVVAQERFADLRVSFLSPSEGDTVVYPNPVPVTFSVYNQGPDTLYSEDELLYAITLSYRTNEDPPLVQTNVPKTTAMGDSFTITVSVPITLDKTVKKQYLLFNVRPRVRNNDPNNKLRGETEAELRDNQPQIELVQLGSTASVAPEQSAEWNVSVYPNPIQITEDLYIESRTKLELREVLLVDNLGRVENLKWTSDGKVYAIKVNGTRRGVYTLILKTEEGTITKKVLWL